MIIPQSMKKDMLQKIHSSHLGIDACTRKAIDLRFLPEMNKDIHNFIQQCETCSEMYDQQQKEPLQTHRLPPRPWSKLALDQFSVDGKDYLVTVDYNSNYFEVDCILQLQRTSSEC